MKRALPSPGSLWWPLYVVVFIVASVAAPATDAATLDLLKALNDIVLEEDATKILEPYMGDVKTLDPAVIEKIVFKQWWQVAQTLIANSHLQHADLSFAVRKAVRALKEEADELLRTLNPKYGQAQQVAPAFQWAQNDTCIFLTVKYTVRWNAPGALEVTSPEVHMEANTFNFTGLGKHSNNKYKYTLALKLFDNLSPSESTWSAASVGKLSVTLKKKWPRKWPRLLQDKKAKIGNMHVWMETQDRLNGQLGGMSTVSHSPVTCSDLKKLYCTVTDTCKLPANCSQCPGKDTPVEAENICAGVPTQKASVAFKDADLDRFEYGGTIKITREKHDFDSDSFVLYWGKDAVNKFETDGQAASIGEAAANGIDLHISLDFNTKKPDEATHLLVFSKNTYGEYNSPQAVSVQDAFLPLETIKSAKFEDEDGDQNEIKGDITVEKPEDDTTIDKYAIYWGKSETHRIDRKKNVTAFLADFDKSHISYFVGESTRIPDQATHLLLYSRNEHGEYPIPVAVKITDSVKPCQHRDGEDCPAGVSVITSPDSSTETLSIQRAKSEDGLVAYTLYWGRAACDEDGTDGASAQNGQLKYFPIEGPLEYELPSNIDVPDGTTHILAFSQNKWGESKFCVSQSFARAASTSTMAEEAAHDPAHDLADVSNAGSAEEPASTGDKQDL